MSTRHTYRYGTDGLVLSIASAIIGVFTSGFFSGKTDLGGSVLSGESFSLLEEAVACR